MFFVVVHSLSHIQLSVTPWTAACQVSLSFTISQSLLKLMSTESVMPSSHLILHHTLLLLSIFPSISLLKWVSSSHQVTKCWSFSFSINLSNEHLGLISFRMDWLDLLVVQGTLYIVQFSHPYMTTGKTIALTTHTFVGKVMSPLFNMLSRLVITFLPKRKHLVISWLQSPSAVIL